MGIALEFGEGSPVSFRMSQSPHSPVDMPKAGISNNPKKVAEVPQRFGGPLVPSPPVSGSRQEEDNPSRRSWPPKSSQSRARLEPGSPYAEASEASEADVSQQYSHDLHSQLRWAIASPSPAAPQPSEIPATREDVPVLQPALLRPSVLSLLDRWRAASKDDGTHAMPSPPPQEGKNIPADEPANALSLDESTKQTTHHRPEASKSPGTRVLAQHAQHTTPPEVPEELRGDYAATLQRAARAREIYLASRAFNHWAEKTATRLEKEAVARRHMIRYRCFFGWSQAPTSNLPAVDHLRTITAVQKLQRAVACQEEQLGLAAAAIAKTHLARKVERLVGQWCCSTVQHSVRRESLYAAKASTACFWKDIVAKQNQLVYSAKKNERNKKKIHIAEIWTSEAQQAKKQLGISKQVGMVRPLFAHLGVWWDRTEAQKRSNIYRANSLWLRAHSALDSWSLRARSQAFVWQNDYKDAIAVVTNWTRKAQAGDGLSAKAASARERFCASDAFRNTAYFTEYVHKLDYYADRARLYIAAKKFMHVLDSAYHASRACRKEELRQQLRTRYKEASAARKKRQFQAAINLWQRSTQQNANLSANAASHCASHEHQSKLNVINSWESAAALYDEQQAIGQKYARHSILHRWSLLSSDLADQESQSWDMWAQRKQMSTLKVWSISSLQGGGKAHTAAKIKQRYAADRRTRAFQSWRYWSQTPNARTSLSGSATPRQYQAFSGRRSWRGFPSRKAARPVDPGVQQPMNFGTPAPMDTPTRWTGKALAMSNSLARPMPSVREADEQSVTTSSIDGNEAENDFQSPSKFPPVGIHRDLVLLQRNIASTTPQAPVPTNLRSKLQPGRPLFKSTSLSQAGSTPQAVGAMQKPSNEMTQPRSVSRTVRIDATPRPGPPNRRAPILSWHGASTPSRQLGKSTREQQEKELPPQQIYAPNTAPQQSRFTKQRQQNSQSFQGAPHRASNSPLHGIQ